MFVFDSIHRQRSFSTHITVKTMSTFTFVSERPTRQALLDRTKELLELVIVYDNDGNSLSGLHNGERTGAIHKAATRIHVMTNTLVSDLHGNPIEF